MKWWQYEYEVEQESLAEVLEACRKARKAVAHGLAPCNAMAPQHVTICGRMYPSGSCCQKVKDHPGGHSTKPSTCNRPLGHEGPHAFIVLGDARKLGEWD